MFITYDGYSTSVYLNGSFVLVSSRFVALHFPPTTDYSRVGIRCQLIPFRLVFGALPCTMTCNLCSTSSMTAFHNYLQSVSSKLIAQHLPGLHRAVQVAVRLPDREASLIKREYCTCGPHPLQVISSRVRPPLVKGAGLIGPLLSEFRGWPPWSMASIALTGGCSRCPIALRGSLT